MKSLRSHQPLDTLPEEKKRGAKHSKMRRKRRKNHSKGLKPKDLGAGGGYILCYTIRDRINAHLLPVAIAVVRLARESREEGSYMMRNFRTSKCGCGLVFLSSLLSHTPPSPNYLRNKVVYREALAVSPT